MLEKDFNKLLVEAVKYRIYQHRKRDMFNFNIYMPKEVELGNGWYRFENEEAVKTDTDICDAIEGIGGFLGYTTMADVDLKNKRIIHVNCEKIV